MDYTLASFYREHGNALYHAVFAHCDNSATILRCAHDISPVLLHLEMIPLVRQMPIKDISTDYWRHLMSIDVLRYELRLMGQKVLLTPVLVMLGFALFALLLHILKIVPSRFLSGGLEMILPIATGIVAGTVAIHDPALELQLTLPRNYSNTGFKRLFLILFWTVCVGLLSSMLIFAFHQQYMLHMQATTPLLVFLATQLTWFATLIWCVAIGLCIALLTRSRSAGGALLAGIWIAEIFFKDLIAPIIWLKPFFLFPTTLLYPPGVVAQSVFNDWLTNRITVLAMGLLILPLCWLLLRNAEGLLKATSEE